jgi:hypothetical protein
VRTYGAPPRLFSQTGLSDAVSVNDYTRECLAIDRAKEKPPHPPLPVGEEAS